MCHPILYVAIGLKLKRQRYITPLTGDLQQLHDLPRSYIGLCRQSKCSTPERRDQGGRMEVCPKGLDSGYKRRQYGSESKLTHLFSLDTGETKADTL